MVLNSLIVHIHWVPNFGGKPLTSHQAILLFAPGCVSAVAWEIPQCTARGTLIGRSLPVTAFLGWSMLMFFMNAPLGFVTLGPRSVPSTSFVMWNPRVLDFLEIPRSWMAETPNCCWTPICQASHPTSLGTRPRPLKGSKSRPSFWWTNLPMRRCPLGSGVSWKVIKIPLKSRLLQTPQALLGVKLLNIRLKWPINPPKSGEITPFFKAAPEIWGQVASCPRHTSRSLP